MGACHLAAGERVTLGWDPSPDADVTGYSLYTGPAAGRYTNRTDVGNVTQAVVTNLEVGATYYFVVTAFNVAGLESDASNELVYSPAGTNQPPPVSPIPLDRLALWLRADGGVDTNGSAVNRWIDQSGNNRHAVQTSTASQPALVTGVINGLPALRFDGADDFLTFALPVNGLSGMTIFLVAANGQNQNGGVSQAERAALFWNETAPWGTLYLSPFQGMVHFRFGTLQAGNAMSYPRATAVGRDFTLSTAVKDGTTDSLYVNGTVAMSQGNKLSTIAGCRDIGNLGRGYNDTTYYAGDIAEVLVYTRALAASDRAAVESYLSRKYGWSGSVAPRIAIAPANVAVQEPAGAQFSVTATGDPPLQYQWWRGTAAIAGATASSYGLPSTTVAVDDGAQFRVVVSNAFGAVTSTVAILTVSSNVVPENALALWLRADAGIVLNGSTVAQWSDQSGNNRHAVQASGGSQPLLRPGALHGQPALRFDGTNDFLTFNLPVNGLTGMTVFLVAANTLNQTGGSSQAEQCALFWNEAAYWGTLYLSPFQGSVCARFGTGQSGNRMVYPRPVPAGSNFTLSTAVKDATSDSLFVNGTRVLSEGGKLGTIAACRDTGNVGRGFDDNTFYAGDMAEVLVYTRALTVSERQAIEAYLSRKYGLTELVAPQITSGPASVAVEAPAPAQFGVTVGGTPPFSFQWLRNGSPIGGAIASTYTLLSTSPADDRALFQVTVSNPYGAVTSAVATLTVAGTVIVTSNGVPQDGLALWLKADAGTVLAGSSLMQWNDQSGNGRHAMQPAGSSQPALRLGAVNGLPAIRFDGTNDFLVFPLPVNGLGGVSIFVVAANTQVQNGGASQAEQCALFWNETAYWGTLYLSPFQENVNLRFGTQQWGNRMVYPRTDSVGSSFTMTGAIKDGTVDSLYVNGRLVMSEAGKLAAMAGCRDVGNVGRGFNDDTYYAGDIAEIVVYTRALTASERMDLENYLAAKYGIGSGSP